MNFKRLFFKYFKYYLKIFKIFKAGQCFVRLPIVSGFPHHHRGGDAFRSFQLPSPKYGSDRTSKGVVDFDVLLRVLSIYFGHVFSLVLRLLR